MWPFALLDKGVILGIRAIMQKNEIFSFVLI